MTEFIWGVRVWLAKEFTRSGKKRKKLKKIFFSIYFTWMNSSIFEWNLHGSKSKTKFFKVEKNWNILFILRHCIYFDTLYLFWRIVFISRHCIYFETLYLFWDIVFILGHCIYFKTLYQFWDIVLISRHCNYFKTLY